MKEIKRHALFKRNFRKRIYPKKKLVSKFKKAIQIFITDPDNPILRSHKLRGKLKDFKSFWVDDDCRVIYKETKDYFIFYDIGSHKEVYRDSSK